MKKIIALLVLAIGFNTSIEAQKRRKGDFEKMSVAQKTELAIKKMTLKLDLTATQQKQIKPLLAEKISKRKALHEKRIALKDSNEKRKELSADERFEKKSIMLDNQIAFKAKMKRILNEQQYERFEKMSGRKMRKMKKHRKNKKGKKNHHKK